MQSLIPNTRLSHGTIECEDCLTSRRFYQSVLGLGSVRPLAEAQYLWSGGPWSLVCVGIGVSNPDQAVEVCAVADGVVVGSALVRRLLAGEGPEGAARFVGELRSAIDDG